jgi:hypothetical protein
MKPPNFIFSIQKTHREEECDMKYSVMGVPLMVGSFIVLAGCSSSDSDGQKPVESAELADIRGGVFNLTEAGAELYDSISGNANLVVTDKTSGVEIHVRGLSANTGYPAHVHANTCAEGGGPHYLQDPEGEDVAENGLWPMLNVNSEGVGYGEVSQDFSVTTDARSVVIHQPESNERIACADLLSAKGYGGSLAATETGEGLYENIQGSAFVAVNTGGLSKAEVFVSGLSAGSTYGSHVHTGDCASGGAGHYLQDTSGEDVAGNGLWPTININEWGHGWGWAQNMFEIRFADANSVIIHETGASDRIACADLDIPLYSFRSGPFTMTQDGESQYGEIAGRALLWINSAGDSVARIYVTGLDANEEYPAHVHNAWCETGGGGHYLQDLDGADEDANGIWPFIATDANGSGIGEEAEDFIVRPDARSVVIHEPGTGTRLACADLR